MVRPRLIPIITLNENGEAVSTISFQRSTYIGDPINVASVFSCMGIDELGIIDLYASRLGRLLDLSLLRKVANASQYPIFAGGGVQSIDDIRIVLENGAEKVLLSSAIVKDPNFLSEAVAEFGTSSIVVCLDCIGTKDSQYVIYDRLHKRPTGLDLNKFIQKLQNLGLGECIVQSVEKDGSMSGYDRNLLDVALSGTAVPIIALGGCSSYGEILELAQHQNLSAYAASSLFSFYNDQRQVLINYPDFEFFRSFNK